MVRLKGAPKMFPMLAIPLVLGWVLARYWLRLPDRLAVLAVAPALAVVLTLVGTNFFYRSGRLESSVWAVLGIEVVALGLLWWKRPREVPTLNLLSRPTKWVLGLVSAVVYIYATAHQIANLDDDYWIHAPLQGLIRHNNFPPINPFFSEIPMNGHYGRNLGITIFSYLSSADVFMSQHLLTSALQVLCLWLFFSAIHYSSRSELSALFGSFFLFFGINAGGRGGLIDTIQNNNAFVHLYLALLCFLVVMVWREERPVTTILAGITLGSYAIVYETHFGLVSLTILGVTPILLARKAITRKGALAALCILLFSLPIAFTQGGPLTDLLVRKLTGEQHTQAESLSKGMQNQAQVVKITFPKKELFQILLETGEYQRTSYVYKLDTPLKHLSTPSTNRGYAYLWSWDVLKIHFLPLYLAPWCAWVLLRRNSFAGLFLGAFGTIAFLVPAVVNFGPIYESEYFRWEFAAALGFAGALGMTLATLLEKIDPPGFAVSREYLLISPSGKRLLLVGLITLLNSLACFTFVGRRLADSVSFNPMKWLIFPSTRDWLMSHSVLNFSPVDFQAAEWLEKRVKPGDRMLVNFSEENNFSILYESTLTGITGARCVGHALPLEDEKIGTTPFRRSPAAQLFWKTYRPEPLAQLKVDWIYLRLQHDEEPPSLPSATLLKKFTSENYIVHVYEVDQDGLPPLSTNSEGWSGKASTADLSVRRQDMRGGRLYSLKLDAETDKKIEGTVMLSTVRESDGLISSPSENLQLWIDSSHSQDIEIPFVAPYDEGRYTLKADFYPHGDSQSLQISSTDFRSAFTEMLGKVELKELTVPQLATDLSALPPTVLTVPTARLAIPDSLPQPREVLACWAFYSLEREEFDLPPALNLSRVTVEEEFRSLPLVTPRRAGTYRLSLYLSAGQGHLARILGPMVEVKHPSGSPWKPEADVRL